jgi:hypothetical protein
MVASPSPHRLSTSMPETVSLLEDLGTVSTRFEWMAMTRSLYSLRYARREDAQWRGRRGCWSRR